MKEETEKFHTSPIEDLIQELRSLKLGQIRRQLEDDLSSYPHRFAIFTTFISAAKEQPIPSSDDQSK